MMEFKRIWMGGSVKYWIRSVCKIYSGDTKTEEKLFLLPLKCYLSTAPINIQDTTFFYLKNISVFYVYFLLFLQYAVFLLKKISFQIKAIHSQTSLKRGQKENSRKNQHFKSYFTFSIMTLSAASQYEILLLYFTKCVTFFAVLRTSHSGRAAILRCRSSITGVRSFQTK